MGISEGRLIGWQGNICRRPESNWVKTIKKEEKIKPEVKKEIEEEKEAPEEEEKEESYKVKKKPEISKEKIADILKSREVNETIIQEFNTVLDNCDYARYTPSTDVMMKQEYEKAKEVIAKIDKEL